MIQCVLKTTPSPSPSHGVLLRMEYLMYQHVTQLLHPLLTLHYLTWFLVLHIKLTLQLRVWSIALSEVIQWRWKLLHWVSLNRPLFILALTIAEVINGLLTFHSHSQRFTLFHTAISIYNSTRVVSLSIEEDTLSCCHTHNCLSITLGYNHMVCIR